MEQPVPRDRFRWHQKARVFGPDGARVVPVAPLVSERVQIVDGARAVAAFTQVAACIRGGTEFCVGPPGNDIVGQQESLTGCFQCMSGGSTAPPKRIRRRHASWIASFRSNRAQFGLGPADRYAVPGLPGHSLPLYAMLEALFLGADLHLLGGIRPDRQAQALAGATVFYATPAQLRTILPHAATLPAMRWLFLGGGELDDATRVAAQACFPNAEIRAFYGATETSFVTMSDADTPRGSVGRAYPSVEIATRNACGNDLPPDAVGEVWVRSPLLFKGYAVGCTTDTRWRDGWLSVGEMGWLDARGYLFLAGRQSRMFTVADQNVFPERIEAWLAEQPGIGQAAVLPRRDARRGQVPVAFVTGRADRDALLRDARTRFGALAAPRALYRLAHWPLLPSGKTDLGALAGRPEMQP